MVWLVLPFIVSLATLALFIFWLGRTKVTKGEIIPQEEQTEPRSKIWFLRLEEKFLQRLKIWFLRRYNSLQALSTKRKEKLAETMERAGGDSMDEESEVTTILPENSQPRTNVNDSIALPRKEASKRFRVIRARVSEGKLIERIAHNPKDVEAYELLGDLYLSRKEYDDAKACYRQVLRLDPRHEVIRDKMKSMEGAMAQER